ncbi:unnamed protein product [Lactuca virosa]|uniref:Uncharacterized protein n=1 Tax=Lactuca virosa TaxID=75947 RepID=A0AAU9MBY0_9ASTR|nr:unnamed protein product [Lactuca virosa]
MEMPLWRLNVCILRGKPYLIHDMIKVVVQGVEYGMVVREISNWEPDIMEEREIGSDISDLSWGGGREDAYFDDDVNDIIDVDNGDKVDEGQEKSFSMDNTPINGGRGVGFVGRKGRFFQTTNKRKGNGAMEGGLSPPKVVVTRGVAENQCNPVVPSPVRVAECELQGDPPHLVVDVEGEGASESPLQPPGFR